MNLPSDYEERVYAGVLGKIIGIYFGLPMEGWPYETVVERLGEITGYTNENTKNKLDCRMPLVNTSDDITGMFTFIRAVSDNEYRRDITAADIGRTWLNYFMPGRTASWWGGMGFSSENTAMVRLLNGIEAPRSGSIELNGPLVAQQIGGRIFIDAWPMIAPGDPEFAVDLARRAASVSHDGECIYGAQMVASMEAQGFVEGDLNRLLDTASALIPKDSIIYRVTQDVREWHAGEPDWKETRKRIEERYGYDKYGGGCHIVPNHAMVILGLLYGDDDLRKSLIVTATAGLDTDCNCSAVGCVLAIKNGLKAFENTPDLRAPVEDRLYVSSTEGGRSITDAVTETYHIVNIGRALADEAPVAPKKGARFHFELPGSVQCFRPEQGEDCAEGVTVENVEGHSALGKRSLAVHYQGVGNGRVARVGTATFTPPEAIRVMARRKSDPKAKKGERVGWLYSLVASPTLYPGQTIRARVAADESNPAAVSCRLAIRSYRLDDELERATGPEVTLNPGESQELAWRAPDTECRPIADVGLEIGAAEQTDGSLYLDYLAWDGAPDVFLKCPPESPTMWDNAWVPAIAKFIVRDGVFRLVHGQGKGLISQGTRDWTDYRATARMASQMATAHGVAVRVQGHRRYYALVLCNDNMARIVKMRDVPTVLAEAECPWEVKSTYFKWDENGTYELSLEAKGATLVGFVDGREVLRATDTDRPLTGGGVGLVLEEGNLKSDGVTVKPL